MIGQDKLSRPIFNDEDKGINVFFQKHKIVGLCSMMRMRALTSFFTKVRSKPIFPSHDCYKLNFVALISVTESVPVLRMSNTVLSCQCLSHLFRWDKKADISLSLSPINVKHRFFQIKDSKPTKELYKPN